MEQSLGARLWAFLFLWLLKLHGDRNVTAMKSGKTFITWSDRVTLRMYASLVTEMLACSY